MKIRFFIRDKYENEIFIKNGTFKKYNQVKRVAKELEIEYQEPVLWEKV